MRRRASDRAGWQQQWTANNEMEERHENYDQVDDTMLIVLCLIVICLIFIGVALLPTGYIPINGGIVAYGGAFITVIQGFWNYPREVKEKCEDTCDCLTKW